MRTALSLLAAVLGAAAAATAHGNSHGAHTAGAAGTRPNMIVLLADDMGYGDVDYMG